MPTLLGCIADDFTGATDLAGLLARSGARVSLRIGVPTTPPEQTAAFEVIALKSRTAPVDVAVGECRDALRWLREAGAKRFFWKYCSTFDSTPEGNIGQVAEALMRDIGTGQTIYCPAFPENGRSVYMGNLFVGQQPLSESPMKDHPLTPMRDSNVLRLLKPQVTQPVGLIDRLTVARGSDAIKAALSALRKARSAHVVIDAVAETDLDAIAEACRDLPLITGGSAVARALPALYAEDDDLGEATQHAEELGLSAQTLILSGSCSSMTNQQVANYLDRGAPGLKLDPLELAERGADEVLAWLKNQDLNAAPLIYATADPASVQAAQSRLGVAEAGQIVEQTLARCAVAARDAGARRFVVAGGETSGAITQALDVSQLDIGPEIAPGVPWTFCSSDGHRIALTLKSGNFGNAPFFSDALARLDTLTQ